MSPFGPRGKNVPFGPGKVECPLFGRDEAGRAVAELRDNHASRRTLTLDEPVTTRRLELSCGPTHGGRPVSLMEVICYE